MLIDTQTIGTSAKAFDVVIPGSEIELDSEGSEIKAEVIVKGEARSVNGRFEVDGTLMTQLDVACARCLEPIALPMNIAFEARFVPPAVFNAVEEHELEGDALTVDVLETGSIDLKDIAREQILLNLPEQLFCSEDCRGLCEKCGANRNLIDCKCIDEEMDPRWAALKNLN